jgi:hypothetical protein
MPTKANSESQDRTTRVVSPEIFKHVYDSPLSLPGKHRWVTKDEDVRTIEKVARNSREKYRRATLGKRLHAQLSEVRPGTNPVAIVSSAVTKISQKALLVEVILGERSSHHESFIQATL